LYGAFCLLRRIKNRRINVITTLKRPVPLEHYLYTGQDGKTRDERFMIVDRDGNFLTHGYGCISFGQCMLCICADTQKLSTPLNCAKLRRPCAAVVLAVMEWGNATIKTFSLH
jgi:hypothetical protein